MQIRFYHFFFVLFGSIYTTLSQETPKTEISVLGTFHFTQIHDEKNPITNFYGIEKQQQIIQVVERLKGFSPNRIYIEREPKHQSKIDSLYYLYLNDKLKLNELKNGAGEIFQIAFRLSKTLNLRPPVCVNHYESTSQSLLETGINIEIHKKALSEFQLLGRNVVGNYIKGESNLLETLAIMNSPENVKKSHQLLFNKPAYVQEGEFSSYSGLNENLLNKKYIGAEFISLFYNRNLKIYSNILNAQQKNKDERILLIVGQTHVGVLEELIGNNTSFKITNSIEVLLNGG